MRTYYSDRELRREFERRFGTISNSQWEEVMPELGEHSPYDQTSLNQCIRIAKRLGYIPEVKEKEVPVILPGEERPKDSYAITYPEALLEKSKLVAEKYREFAENLRADIGLKEPLPRENLASFLLPKFRGDMRNAMEMVKKGGPEFAKKAFFASEHEGKGKLIKQGVKRLALATGWSEEDTLEFVLCRTVPLLPYIYAIYRLTPKPSITITIGSLDVPAETIRQTYINARREIQSWFGKKATDPRPDRRSKTTAELIKLVEETPNLSWGERYKRWKGPYQSPRNMCVAYSRAKKRYGLS